ncbi:hypothetical protein [Pedobacter sp. L105]|uniref:hypothetical protein n=1 Tax=Pedobacter sp. L105 TaxID=1641871 RepID=UPI00131BD60B|nr:hypothetical protein [Pedobacter sp. L105]
MADLEENNPGFDISVQLDGENKNITVQPDETSDGVEYFICKVGDDQITQVRFDNGKWDQLWGELSQEEVDAIGHEIEQEQQ